jgi:hypothetical protein
MTGKYRVLLLVIVAVVLSVFVLGLSVTLLPDAPVSPTPTYPEGIDFPDGRDVPRR